VFKSNASGVARPKFKKRQIPLPVTFPSPSPPSRNRILVHVSLKIWHLVANILIIFLRINWPNFVHFYDSNTLLQVSKQASTANSVCEVWKQELSTLIAISLLIASSWFSANYTIDQPGRFFYLANSNRRQLPPIACYWLRPCVMWCNRTVLYLQYIARSSLHLKCPWFRSELFLFSILLI